jgi:hypothetical protein
VGGEARQTGEHEGEGECGNESVYLAWTALALAYVYYLLHTHALVCVEW